MYPLKQTLLHSHPNIVSALFGIGIYFKWGTEQSGIPAFKKKIGSEVWQQRWANTLT